MTDGPRPHRFLTIDQVAEELAVGLPTVRMLLKSGELGGIQIGGRGLWRIGAKNLADYIEQAYRITADRIAAGEVPDGDAPVILRRYQQSVYRSVSIVTADRTSVGKVWARP